MWNDIAGLAIIDRREFDSYFQGRTVAYALEVTNVWEYQSPVALDWLRGQFGDFVVPQSWRYVKADEYEAFEMLRRQPNEEGKNAVMTSEFA